MHIRRPLAALITALALLGGGGATLTACGDPAGQDRSDGTTDEQSNTGGANPGDESQGDLPDNTDPEPGQDQDGDTQDPD